MKRIFSGVQPTGDLHLGNYLGAIKNWVSLQEQFDSLIFSIVDLHAMTVLKHKYDFKKSVIDTAITYIACGVDVEKSVIFLQSEVAEHTQLAWILSCLAPVSLMNRMTQFKDKKNKSSASLGLYSYPLLMASDILLYKATHVPVGDDQTQHLELTRDIAHLFNSFYEQDYFPLPKTILPDFSPRIMSLKDGSVKMSKSDPSSYSRINLSDNSDLIKKKIAKAKSDSIIGFDLNTLSSRPEARNLINIYSHITNESIESVCNEISNFFILKNRLTDALVSSLSTLHEKILNLQKDDKYIESILEDGKEKAQEIASKHFNEVKKIVKMYN